MNTRTELVVVIVLAATAAARGEDWAQVAANTQRTAHVADQPNPPYKLAWHKTWWPEEVILYANQPIIVGGVVYVASANGVVHALKTEDGGELWRVKLGCAIINGFASDGRNIFVASCDGAVRAFDKETGKEVWTAGLSRRPFMASPLLMDGRLLIGSRDGVFYAVSAQTGDLLWKYDSGTPIVQSAAGDQGRVIFANEAISAYCLEAQSGKVLWGPVSLPGRTCREYWPVVYKDKVIIQTAEAGRRTLSGNNVKLQKRLFWPIFWGPTPPGEKVEVRVKAKTPEDILKDQDIFVAFFREHPEIRTFLVLNLADGKEPYTASVLSGCRNHGVPPPPVMAGDGNLYAVFHTSAANRGVVNITDCGLGRFDAQTGKISMPLLCGQHEVGKVIGARAPFEMTSDETTTFSSGGKIIFSVEGCWLNAPTYFNVETRTGGRVISDPPIRPCTEGMWGGALVVISGKHGVVIRWNHVVCFRGQ